MANEKLGKERIYICCSSSIENWKAKILKRYHGVEYVWWRDWRKPVVFFGFYNPIDWLKFCLHRGGKTIHWCGSDILQTGYLFRWLKKVRCQHICETAVEEGILKLMLQQDIELRPTFLSDPSEFPVSFTPSKKPHVWMHVHKNAERESRLDVIKRIAAQVPDITFHIYGRVSAPKQERNIIYHGFVEEEQFNNEIKNYQCGISLREFDGMSEVIMKSVLMGQYPISRVRIPYIDTFNSEDELIFLLRDLKNKKLPNPYRNWWFNKL